MRKQADAAAIYKAWEAIERALAPVWSELPIEVLQFFARSGTVNPQPAMQEWAERAYRLRTVVGDRAPRRPKQKFIHKLSCICSSREDPETERIGIKPDTVTCGCGFSWCARCHPASSPRCWNEINHLED